MGGWVGGLEMYGSGSVGVDVPVWECRGGGGRGVGGFVSACVCMCVLDGTYMQQRMYTQIHTRTYIYTIPQTKVNHANKGQWSTMQTKVNGQQCTLSQTHDDVVEDVQKTPNDGVLRDVDQLSMVVVDVDQHYHKHHHEQQQQQQQQDHQEYHGLCHVTPPQHVMPPQHVTPPQALDLVVEVVAGDTWVVYHHKYLD